MFHRACCIYYNNAPASPRAPPRRAYPRSAGVRARRRALAGVQQARASLPLVEVQLPSSAHSRQITKTRQKLHSKNWVVITCVCNNLTCFEWEVHKNRKRKWCKSAENSFEKLVTSFRVNLFLAYYTHLKPQCRALHRACRGSPSENKNTSANKWLSSKRTPFPVVYFTLYT